MDYFPRVKLLCLTSIFALVLSACAAGDPGAVVVDEPAGSEAVVEEAATAVPVEEEIVEEPVGPTDLNYGEYGVMGMQDGMILASNLLNYSIENTAAENLGTIEDLLVDLQTGNILFARVEHGGFLDIGDEDIMVPLSALEPAADVQEFLLTADPQVFELWPELGADWPDITDDTWDDQVVSFWEDAGAEIFWNPTGPMNTVAWVSNLIGFDLDFGSDFGNGNLEDMAIDLSQSRAKYALMAFDVGVFSDDAWRAVPFSAINASALEGGEVFLQPDFDVNLLNSTPTIDPNVFGDAMVFAETWDDELDTFWEDAGYDVAITDQDVADIAEETANQDIAATGMGFAQAEQDVMMLASSILDREVESMNEDQLGFVDDFFIDLDTGNILFALVEHGGFLDIGEERVPVPLTAMSMGPENDELILNIEETVFENLPDMTIDSDWPLGLDATWDDDLLGFWEGTGFVVDRALFESVNPDRVASAADLVGYGVGFAGVTGAGTADDFLVDLGNGKVDYALLSLVDVTLYGTDWRVVPFQAFDPQAFGQELVFDQDFDIDLLANAPALTNDAFVDTMVVDATWDDEIEQYWVDQGFDIE